MLTDDQLNGLEPVVITNNNTKGERIIESDKAYIIKVKQGDRQGIHALVNIDGEKVERWIFAKDQELN